MIVTITINPAMDQVLVLDSFALNVTNRIRRQFRCVGGKGTHIAMNLDILGVPSSAFGVAAGPVGREILDALARTTIDLHFIHLEKGNSRTNFVLVDNAQNCTLIAEKGEPLDEAVLQRLAQDCATLIDGHSLVVISGDASNDRGAELFRTLMDVAQKKRARLCLDTGGEFLKSGVERQPFLIKPNLHELSQLFGRDLRHLQDIASALRELAAKGIPHIVLSMGKEGSLTLSEGRFYRVNAPQVMVKNTVGCGDALLSGILAGFEQGLDIQTNLRRATAIAAAKAGEESTVGFDPASLPGLEKSVSLEMIEL